MKETKSSGRADAGLSVSQCFYTATEFSKSVNLALVQRDPNHPGGRSQKISGKRSLIRMKARNPKKIATARRKKDLRRKRSPGSEMRLIGPAIDLVGRFMF